MSVLKECNSAIVSSDLPNGDGHRKKEKLVDRNVDFGFGFPVVLLNVPMIRIRGIWTPNINQKTLKKPKE